MAKVNKNLTKALKIFKDVKALGAKSSVVLSSEQIKEKIVMLRADMSQAINLSTATSILALLLFIGAPSVFPEIINPYLPSSLKIMQAFVMVPSVFWLLTILGNMARFVMIFKLQKNFQSRNDLKRRSI